jgi:hypothetical protein
LLLAIVNKIPLNTLRINLNKFKVIVLVVGPRVAMKVRQIAVAAIVTAEIVEIVVEIAAAVIVAIVIVATVIVTAEIVQIVEIKLSNSKRIQHQNYDQLRASA